jgi:hypothetical protein
MKGGGRRRGVKGGVGVASDGAVLLVEGGLPDRKTERMLDVDGLRGEQRQNGSRRAEEE